MARFASSTVGTALLLGMAAVGHAAPPIYRCGNEYTNTPPAASRSCTLVEGGNVTIVHGPAQQTSAAPVSARPMHGARVERSEQTLRDQEAGRILRLELEKTQARMQELQNEYQNGQPERLGSERNYQRYLDRKEKLQADMARTQGDIDGLQNEIRRLPQSANNTATAP